MPALANDWRLCALPVSWKKEETLNGQSDVRSDWEVQEEGLGGRVQGNGSGDGRRGTDSGNGFGKRIRETKIGERIIGEQEIGEQKSSVAARAINAAF
jgi:hypothetical protein